MIADFSEAMWIGSAVWGGPRSCVPAPYFRAVFKLGGPVRSATLSVTALGLYTCEVNGRAVGDHVFAPGWTDYRKRVCYQSYDVADLLRDGENVLGVILGDGWYCGQIAEKDRQQYGDRPLLLAQLEITHADGSITRIASSPAWKTTTGPILEADLLRGEAYDARHELGAWSSPGYDDRRWQPSEPAAAPDIAIERSEAPPVRRIDILPPLKQYVAPWFSRALVCDFGQNFTGRISLTVRGLRGVHLKIRYAEMLDAKGRLYTDNLRGARCTDYYTLKGEGLETWEPRFTFHGFRYVEISWSAGPADPVIERVVGVVLHSDMAVTGTFTCSHPLINQLEHNIVWGQKSNFLEVPTDCPQRDERLGWTGDAQAFIRTAAFHMDVQGFFHKWLKDMRDAQTPEGAIPPVIPNTHSFGLPPDGGPAWADAVMICPWTVYRCYDDLDVLRAHYACMAGYMDYLAGHKVRDYIRAHPDVDTWGGFGDWLALDGSGKTEGGTPKDLIGTAFYANNADIMARTATLLEKPADARRYRELHGRIVEAFRRRFVSPDGLLSAGTQTAYVLALHFGLVPEGVRAATARELVRRIESNGMRLATGFVGTPYLLHVLEAHGHLDVAYKLLEQEAFPSWLFPVKQGATTIWERWDGWTPDKGFQEVGMNSFNHYAYGAVGDWMVSTVAGLEIGEPGYRKILFKPRPGGSLTSAEARLKTPYGQAAIRWELRDRKLLLRLTVPNEATAELSLPAGWQSACPGTLGPGSHDVEAVRL
jgi:alpha-L-rhamnosidase